MNNKRAQITRLAAGLLALALVLTVTPMAGSPVRAQAPTEIFISEYVEGSSNNKALEIYNGTGAAIDLAAGGYSIEIYFNGNSSAGTTIALTGTVADGDVYVVADDGAVAAILAVTDQTSTSNFFNGDDAVVLKKGSAIIDVIGQVGTDPGDYWGSGDITTQNHTLRRKETVEAGDTNGGDAFDPSVEWDGYPVDTFDGLGSHTTGELDYTPIYDIQYTTDASGDSPLKDQVGVTTEGIVTFVLYNGYFIEDPAGDEWNGLWVYDSTNSPARGDHVRLTGTVVEYNTLTELKDVTGYDVLSSGNPLPDPVVLATGDVSQEMWESVLVRVENVTVTDGDLGHGEWSVSDGSGDVIIDDKGAYTYVPTTGDELTAVIGPLDYSFDVFKMLPRDDSDIIFGLDYTPIYDIQYTADSSGDSPLKNQAGVTTEGIVTARFLYGYFIQDPAGGAWNGLWVHDTTNAPDLGDRVRLTGTVREYYNLTELDYLTGYAVESSGNALPDPQILSSGDVAQEQWESVLLRVENVSVTDDNLGNGEWAVSDGSGDARIDDKGSYTYGPTTGDALIAVIGPLDYAYGDFKIQPRDDGDIILPSALVINEIHADPAGDLTGDANGDGVRDSGDDEFIEIVNNSDSDVDISGWTLSDGYGVRHTFLEGMVVSANCSVVVFGGGTPTGGFGGAVVQTANGAYNQLGLGNSGDTITLSDGTTDLVVVTYGSEGGDNQSLTRDPDITGEFVKHSTATDSGGALFSPGTMIDGSLFSGCSKPFGACGDPATFIHDIQGSGATSPDVGNVHEIEGVVVGDFQAGEHLSGFFIQEEDTDADADPTTSEGIFVYDDGFMDVNVGDVVRVMGEVSEYYDLTELVSISDMAVCGSSSIAPTEVDLPADLEPYEGMLVTFPEDLTASQNYFQGRYGQVTMSSEGRLFNPTNTYRPLTPEAITMAEENMRRMFVLDDGTTSQNPYPIPYIGAEDTLRAGDTVAGLTGVVDYGPINSSYPPARYYRLHPTQEPVEFTRVNERTTAPSDVGGVIKITSFNVLNYFNGDGLGGGFPTSRGADTLDEFNRQRDKIISAIIAMDADVIGLMEIENDGYDQYSAIADLVNGLNDVAGAGTYAFIDPGVAQVGTDEIAVGFIYKPGTVTPVGAAAILDSSVDPDFNSDYNRPALAQTFERSTGGGRFTAAVNHLKSKGSSCDAIGDPDLGDGQGNCNLTRTDAAEALAEWLLGDPTGSGDSDFFIIGDLNSYAMEDPIIAIEDAGYTNLVKAFSGTWAYSYIFDGQSGYLDHALASPGAVSQVSGATAWHINTDEPSVIDYNVEYKSQDLYTPTPYRSSDHDPVVVGFCEAVPPVVEVSVTPDTLWPPNHKYVTVEATVDVSDNIDLNPMLTLVSVTSNEPDDGLDDEDVPNDIVIVNDFAFDLRAERSDSGDGRIYTITYQVTDACGNSTVATVTVTVPHDQGKEGD
jgi:predicted extracellular nuclease